MVQELLAEAGHFAAGTRCHRLRRGPGRLHRRAAGGQRYPGAGVRGRAAGGAGVRPAGAGAAALDRSPEAARTCWSAAMPACRRSTGPASSRDPLPVRRRRAATSAWAARDAVHLPPGWQTRRRGAAGRLGLRRLPAAWRQRLAPRLRAIRRICCRGRARSPSWRWRRSRRRGCWRPKQPCRSTCATMSPSRRQSLKLTNLRARVMNLQHERPLIAAPAT